MQVFSTPSCVESGTTYENVTGPMTAEAVVEEGSDQGSGAEIRDSPVVEGLLNELLHDVVGLESDIRRVAEVLIMPEVEEEVLQPAISDPVLGSLVIVVYLF